MTQFRVCPTRCLGPVEPYQLAGQGRCRTHFNLNYKPLQFTQQAKWHCSAERLHLCHNIWQGTPCHALPHTLPHVWHPVKEVAQCLPADASFRRSKQHRQIAAGASRRYYRSQRLLLKLCAKCSIYQSKVLKINEKCVESLSLPAEAASQSQHITITSTSDTDNDNGFSFAIFRERFPSKWGVKIK